MFDGLVAFAVDGWHHDSSARMCVVWFFITSGSPMKEGRFVLGTFRSKPMRVLYRSHQNDCLRVMFLILQEHYNSGRFIQEVQSLTPIVQFTVNIFGIPFRPQWSCLVSSCPRTSLRSFVVLTSRSGKFVSYSSKMLKHVVQQSFECVDVSVFVKMDKIEYRAVIKYLFLKGNTPTHIKDELDSVYGDSASSFTTVKFWAAEFKRGHQSLREDERSGRLNTATTDENFAKIFTKWC
ncbi:HTH_48 domain-containing protein [Trichonephila clavipes]|nr:HTH_48 domain-containing protein [Trichonephila clavipes]